MSAVETPVRSRLRPETVERATAQFLALGASLAIALAFGSLLILLYGENPLVIYRQIIESAFGSATGVGYVLSIATPLIFSALAVSVCFKAGLFNIGVEGQFLIGVFFAAVVGAYLHRIDTTVVGY